MSNPPPATKVPPWLSKLGRGYQALGMGIFNMFVAMVLFNLALAVLFWLRGPEPGTADFNPSDLYPAEKLAAVYPDFSREERETLLHETWSREYVYDDYVLFKERPCKGKYVNVTEAAFRMGKDQGPWPPNPTNFNLFMFGGSTTFGSGLPDAQTVPSCLQEALAARTGRRVCVYNFGCSYYHSTQERITFERLLCRGHRPDMVVFLDGMNDVHRLYDELPYRQSFERHFDLNNGERALQALIHITPTGRLLRGLERRISSRPAEADLHERQAETPYLLNRYLTNKVIIEGICRELGITPVFVWQPSPGYKYDLKYHLFAQADYPGQAFAYESLAKIARNRDLGSSFLWCADLQENEQECLYVDAAHYSAKFARKLANAIADMITARGLLKGAKGPS